MLKLRADAPCFIPNSNSNNNNNNNEQLQSSKINQSTHRQKTRPQRRSRRKDQSQVHVVGPLTHHHRLHHAENIKYNELSCGSDAQNVKVVSSVSRPAESNDQPQKIRSRNRRYRKKKNKQSKEKVKVIESNLVVNEVDYFPPLVSISHLPLQSQNDLEKKASWLEKTISIHRQVDLKVVEQNDKYNLKSEEQLVLSTSSGLNLLKLPKHEYDLSALAGTNVDLDSFQVNNYENESANMTEPKSKIPSKQKSALWRQLIEFQQQKLKESHQVRNDNESRCSCSSSKSYSSSSEQSNTTHFSMDSSQDQFYSSQEYPLHAAVCRNDSTSLSNILVFADVEETAEWAKISHYCNQSQINLVQEQANKLMDTNVLTRMPGAHLAVWLDYPQVLKSLLDNDHRAILSIVDGMLWTPLMLACALSRDGCVQIILCYGTKHAFVKHATTGDNSIHQCCRYGDLSTLRILLTSLNKSSGIKQQHRLFCCQNKEGQSPWHIICEMSKTDMVEVLLTTWVAASFKGLTIKDKLGNTPFINAVRVNAIDIVTLLLMRSLGGNILQQTGRVSELCPSCPVCIAVRNLSVDMVNLLLHSYSENKNVMNLEKALQDAVDLKECEGKYEIVKLLVGAGAKPHAGTGVGFSPLLKMVLDGNCELLRDMIDSFKEARRLSRIAREKACGLQGYSTGYFDELDAKEDNSFDEAVKEGLLMALMESWKFAFFEVERTSQACRMLDKSLLLLKRGVTLSDLSINRLLSYVQKTKSSKVHRKTLSKNSIKTSYEGFYPDLRNLGVNLDIEHVYSRGSVSHWASVYFQIPWVNDTITNDIYCPWILNHLEYKPKDIKFDYEDDDIFYLCLRDKVLVAHKSIVSAKCEKLAAAIQFEALKRHHSGHEDIVRVECNLGYDLARLLLEHCYVGSIVSGLPAMREDCCRMLLDLANISNEYLCPSLLLECESRLLSTKPFSCFCHNCSSSVKLIDEDLTLVRVSVQGPSLLINGSTALDVITTAQDIGSMPILSDNHYRLRRTYDDKLKNGYMYNHVKGSNTIDAYSNDLVCRDDDDCSPYPFYLAKILALRSILIDFRKVESSDTFIQYCKSYTENDDTYNKFSHEVLISCLDELSAAT